MSIDPVGVVTGLLVLIGASAAAWFLKQRMDRAAGVEVVGWALTLMVVNVLQLVGVLVLLAGIFSGQ